MEPVKGGVLGIVMLLIGCLLMIMQKEQRTKEPNTIRIWVSGETQKKLFFEQEGKPLIFEVVNTNKASQVGSMSFDPKYQAVTISIESPGGLSGGYEVNVIWPGQKHFNDFYKSSEFHTGTFCFEYKVADDDQFIIGNYLRPMKCQK